MADDDAGGSGKSKHNLAARSQIDTKSMSRMKMRRMSYGFRRVSGIKPIERSSQLTLEFKRPQLSFLNTYQLEPITKFHIDKTEELVVDVLDDMFADHKYNVQESPAVALRISGTVMRRLKNDYNRYRIISVVTIGQKRAQSYNNSITFLWDHERDGYVDVQREVSSAFIQVTVFAVYLD